MLNTRHKIKPVYIFWVIIISQIILLGFARLQEIRNIWTYHKFYSLAPYYLVVCILFLLVNIHKSRKEPIFYEKIEYKSFSFIAAICALVLFYLLFFLLKKQANNEYYNYFLYLLQLPIFICSSILFIKKIYLHIFIKFYLLLIPIIPLPYFKNKFISSYFKNISAAEKLRISKDLKLMMYIILAMFIFIIITFFVLIIKRKISEKNMRLKSKLKAEYFDVINNFLYENIGLTEIIEKLMPINYPIYLMTVDEILNIVKGDFHNKVIELSKTLKVYDFLINETNSAKWWIKVKALYHLGRLNYIDGLEDGLYDKLITDKSADVRTALVMALSYLDNEKAIEIISKLLFDQNSIVREKAKEALLKFNNKSYNFLVNLLKDTNDIEKIVMILKILALLKNYNFIAELDKYINNEDLRIQIAAIEVAGALEYPISFDILKEKIKMNNENLTKTILKNITNIADESAIDLIKNYISHKDWEIRYYTARGLYSLGEKGKKELEKIKDTTNDKYAIDMINMVIDEMKFV